jgi:hypothetical protein
MGRMLVLLGLQVGVSVGGLGPTILCGRDGKGFTRIRVSPPQNCKQLLYVKIELLFNDHWPHAQTS